MYMPPKKKNQPEKEPEQEETTGPFNFRFPKGNINPATNYIDSPISAAEYSSNIVLINTFLSSLNQEVQDYVQRPTPDKKLLLEEHLNTMALQTAVYSELPLSISSNMREPLKNTKEDINNAQKMLEYIPYSSTNSFAEKPRTPKPIYIFDPSTIIDIFVEFSTNALTPTELSDLIFNYGEAIETIFSKKTEPIEGSALLELLIAENMLEREIKTRTRGIPEKEANYAYTSIVSAFNMFISLGNFEINEDGIVEELNADEPINKTELDHSAFIMISTHGTLMSSPKRTPPGLSVFIQKQAEPFKPSVNCGVAQMEKCLGDCVLRKEKRCRCVKRFLDYQTMARDLSAEMNSELEEGKMPSVMELQHLMNQQKIHQMSELFEALPEKQREFVYEKSTYPSSSKYVARVPIQTTMYAEKVFSIEPKGGLFGVYNLMSGELINSNPTFIAHHRRLIDSGSPNIGVIELYEIPPVGASDIIHSEENKRVVYIFTLTSLLNYFSSLNYHNVFVLDLSCESPENPNIAAEELEKKRETLGRMGFGKKKHSRRKRNTTKHSTTQSRKK